MPKKKVNNNRKGGGARRGSWRRRCQSTFPLPQLLGAARPPVTSVAEGLRDDAASGANSALSPR